MTEQILPTPAQIVGPAMDRFYELRPRAFKHINLGEGIYSYIFEGWKAQAALEIKRVGQLIRNNRRSLATGKELAEYVASEFFEEPTLSGTSSLGHVTLTRSEGSLAAGVIQSGTRILRTGEPLPPFFLTGAEYETVGDGQVLSGNTSITLKIRATQPGTRFNTPYDGATSPSTGFAISSPIFDDNFSVTSHSVAGGSDGASDAYLRHLAKYAALGKSGPTPSAAVLGALRANGARAIATYLDNDQAATVLAIADDSWSSSQVWCDTVKQYIYDQGLVGFGCKIDVVPVINKVISVTLTVRVRDAVFLNDTTTLTANIGSALKSYFDNREDWYIWKTAGIKSSVIRADRKILNCTSVTVTSSGGTVTEPTISDAIYHYYLPLTSVRVNYLPPV